MKAARLLILFSFIANNTFSESYLPEFSTAGFFKIENSPRKTWNFNTGWRFIKKDVPGAEAININDSSREVVNVSHGLEIIPEEARGGINYQEPAWYRKHLTIKPKTQGKKITMYFEAIMGKSKVYLNGKPYPFKPSGAQENDINYWIRFAYEGLNEKECAIKAWAEAAVGLSEPAAAMYYNHQQSDKIFYQGFG